MALNLLRIQRGIFYVPRLMKSDLIGRAAMVSKIFSIPEYIAF